MSADLVYSIVYKLIGDIQPIGDSGVDSIKQDRLKIMLELNEKIITDIWSVANGNNNYLNSIANNGVIADKYLKELRKELEEREDIQNEI